MNTDLESAATRNGVAEQRTSNGKLLGGVTGRGFLPGKSGNPRGRKKGSGIQDRLRRLLEADDGRVAEALAQAIVTAALKGDFRYCQEILNRVDGKVPNRVAVEDSGPLIRQVTFDLGRVTGDTLERDDPPG